MNVAATTRIGVYLFAALATVSEPALAKNDAPRPTAAGWREPLRQAEAALVDWPRPRTWSSS